MKQKPHCNKFNKDFKNGTHKKKSFLKKGIHSTLGLPNYIFLFYTFIHKIVVTKLYMVYGLALIYDTFIF